MKKWRAHLYGFTGLYVVFGIWTPILWFVSHVREHYRMETFDIHLMNWFGALLFFLLVAATLLAQFGFALIAHDLAEQRKAE